MLVFMFVLLVLFLLFLVLLLASEPLASGVEAAGESTGFIAANMDESNCVGPVTAPVIRRKTVR